MLNIGKTKDFMYEIQKRKNAKRGSAGILTSILEDRKNVLNLKVLVCLDISGSISQNTFIQFMRVIDQIRGLSVVKVIETDDRVVSMYDYFKTDQDRVVRLQGGGGTEFSEAFEKAKEIKPDLILFMTDGMVQGVVSDPGIPTAWILTHGGTKPYDFGTVVYTLPVPENDAA
jgi:predicted metal-dependent peptidase